MALGNDVRDILELEGVDEKDEFITKEALFSDPKKVFTYVSHCNIRILLVLHCGNVRGCLLFSVYHRLTD